MRLKVDMTLSAETAQRFREVAERLGHSDHDDDGFVRCGRIAAYRRQL
jgi:hypothetical protein